MHAQLLDVFRCVERLSETSPASLRKLVQRDSLIAAVPRTEAEPAFKVDTRELLRRLPLHVMACVLAQEPREEGKTRSPLPVGGPEELIRIRSQECIERSDSAGDWVASKLTSQELSTASWHGHVTKALRLLCLLCALAPSLPALASALTVSHCCLWHPAPTRDQSWGCTPDTEHRPCLSGILKTFQCKRVLKTILGKLASS